MLGSKRSGYWSSWHKTILEKDETAPLIVQKLKEISAPGLQKEKKK